MGAIVQSSEMLASHEKRESSFVIHFYFMVNFVYQLDCMDQGMPR